MSPIALATMFGSTAAPAPNAMISANEKVTDVVFSVSSSRICTLRGNISPSRTKRENSQKPAEPRASGTLGETSMSGTSPTPASATNET
jgi:hypothetical protein